MKEIMNAYRRKGFVFCFRDLMKRMMPLWFTRNTRAIETIYAQRTYRYLCRRYGGLAKQPLAPLSETTAPRKIWICWLQGIEDAPVVVKRCVQSIEQYCKGFEIVYITGKNMYDYAPLPPHIKERIEQGRIPFAHFTDVLRTAILVEHGGIWVDATVLLTGPIPENILKEPFFMFQNPRPFQLPHATSNWFIVSAKAHPLMQRQLELLYAFWQREHGLIDYFMYYILFYILITENGQAEKLFNEMLYLPNTDARILQTLMTQTYSKKEWCQLCSLTPIHKLNWKLSEEDLSKQGTYCEFLLRRTN